MNNALLRFRGLPRLLAPVMLWALVATTVACGRTALSDGGGVDSGGAGGDPGEGGFGGDGGFGAQGAAGGKGSKGGSGGTGAVIGGGGSGGRGGSGGTPPKGGMGGSAVSRLLIEPGFVTIAEGQSTQLRATALQDGVVRDVTNLTAWSVVQTDTAMATPDRPGRIMGLKAGKAQIKATFANLSVASDVQVVSDKLLGVSMKPFSTSLNPGGVVQISVVGSFASGQQRDLTADAKWSSDNLGVATINHLGVPGLMLAVGAGDTLIRAFVRDLEGIVGVNVVADNRLTLVLEPPDATRRPGETVAFRATGVFADGTQRNVTNNAVWISSDPMVATVERGQARCAGVGDAKIVATFDGFSVQGILSCRDAVIQLLRLTPVETELPQGARLQYTATAFFSDGTSLIVTDSTRFSSQDPKVANVTSRGQVTAGTPGTTLIIGTFDGVSGQATLTVL